MPDDLPDDKVESLSRWLHEVFLGCGTELAKRTPSWENLKEDNRYQYRYVAERLLSDPPQELKGKGA